MSARREHYPGLTADHLVPKRKGTLARPKGTPASQAVLDAVAHTKKVYGGSATRHAGGPKSTPANKARAAEMGRIEAARLEMVERVVALGLKRRATASRFSFERLRRMLVQVDLAERPAHMLGETAALEYILGGKRG